MAERLPGVRMRQVLRENTEVIARNGELFEGVREELRRNREAADRNAEAFDRHAAAFDRYAEAFDRNAAAFNSDRQVMRSLVAELKAHRKNEGLKSEAMLGAIADLVAEIRRWRGDGGSGAPA